MERKQEMERILHKLLGDRCAAENLKELTDVVDFVCLTIDNLLWEQEKPVSQEQQSRLHRSEKHSHPWLTAVERKGMTGQVNVAIDGPCGSGKTTLGTVLQEVYDCNLFHMDDFFLRTEQRTAARYQEPGGNVDYERFRAEVLEHLSDREGVAYRRFDCSVMGLGDEIKVPYKRLNIIEGSYSCHPYFGEEIYALRFFLEIEPERQRERIIARCGEERWQRFAAEWIPMENRYFDALHIRRKCIIV